MKKFLPVLVFFGLVTCVSAVDLSITATSVLKGSENAQVKDNFFAAETITAGQVLYKATSTTVGLATSTNATKAVVFGVALNGGAVSQPIKVVSEDSSFVVGGTMTTGAVYVLSITPGGIAPIADLTSTWIPAVLCVAKSTTVANLKILQGTNPVP